MPKIQPNIKNEKKQEVLDFMFAMEEAFEMRFEINIRTFVHCLNIRVANDFPMDIGGEKIQAWKMLIKQYLVKK